VKSSALKALKIMVRDINAGSNNFLKDPLFLDHQEELAIRGLVWFSTTINESEIKTRSDHRLTRKGFEALDDAEFWPKFRKAMFGSVGKIATHVLSFLLGAAALKVLSPYVDF